MSDDFNLNPNEDKHYVNLTPKDKEEGDLAPSVAYDAGYKFLNSKGFFLERSVSGSHCYHHVYRLKRPTRIKGIKTPPTFKVFKKLHSSDDLTLFQNTIKELSNIEPLVFKFWLPMLNVDIRKAKPIYQYVLQLIESNEFERNYESTEPIDLGISTDPITDLEDDQNILDVAPRAWLPRKEWFDPKLHQLKLEDILTIFPPVERQLLSLIIGRAVVGKNNNLHRGYDEPITHTSRMCALVIGDAGIGKSTILDSIINALTGTGYTRSTFENIGSRFNMAEPITSDILYVDDATQKSIKDFVKSPLTKKVITGHGLIRTEEKGVDAVNVEPRATIIIVTNEYNPRLVYDIDSGTADRIKILSTYKQAEIDNLVLNTISDRSPDIRPHHHLDWLATELNVSKKAILLWLARLSADNFLDTIKPQENGVNLLEQTVERLTLRLRIPLHKNITMQVICGFFFFQMFMDFDHKLRVDNIVKAQQEGRHSEFTSHSFEHSASTMFNVIGNDQSGQLLSLIKWHYDNLAPDSEIHPWHAIKYLDPTSLRQALVESKAITAQPQMEQNTTIFEHLMLKTGLPLTKDQVWLIASYNSALVNCEFLANICHWLAKVVHTTDICDYQYVEKIRTGKNDLSCTLKTPVESILITFTPEQETVLKSITLED